MTNQALYLGMNKSPVLDDVRVARPRGMRSPLSPAGSQLRHCPLSR